MASNELSFNLLVLDATQGTGDLLQMLQQNHPTEDTEFVSSTQSAETKLKSGKYEALLINDPERDPAMLAGICSAFMQQFPLLAVIVAVNTESKSQLSALLSTGVHGVLLLPASAKDLRKTFNLAFKKIDELRPLGEGSREQIANFPWILENVASRLDSLAQRLREQETEGEPVAAAPNSIKEALLSAIGSTESDKQFCDDFMEWLESKQKDRPKKKD